MPAEVEEAVLKVYLSVRHLIRKPRQMQAASLQATLKIHPH